MEIKEFSAAEWKIMAHNAHLSVFNEIRDPEMNRIDFAYLIVDGDVPLAYGTYREVDSETIYMQYGGAFPSAAKSKKAVQAYLLVIGRLKEKYKRVTTLIENTNTAMMKLAMFAGLKVIGVRNFKGSILLEHFIEWE